MALKAVTTTNMMMLCVVTAIDNRTCNKVLASITTVAICKRVFNWKINEVFHLCTISGTAYSIRCYRGGISNPFRRRTIGKTRHYTTCWNSNSFNCYFEVEACQKWPTRLVQGTSHRNGKFSIWPTFPIKGLWGIPLLRNGSGRLFCTIMLRIVYISITF